MKCLWSIFGNNDDWPPPNWYRPQEPIWKRKAMWLLRNPCHNLTFYVLGVTGKPFERVGRYPRNVFSPGGGWNWAVIRYKWLRLPFISYIGKVKFYMGWRERGNLGLKFTIVRSPR
jgi:hypothetical protein